MKISLKEYNAIRSVWHRLKKKCNENSNITMCNEWQNINNFIEWHLENKTEKGSHLKCISNHYSPEACFFARSARKIWTDKQI